MRFQNDFAKRLDKIVQAAAEFLRHEPGGRMSYLRLLKLLYIADREALKEHGRSITGDTVVAMKHGPVLSGFYDSIKHTESAVLDPYLAKEGYQLRLKADPGKKRLNLFELRKIKELSDRYRDVDDWELVERTHAFPEWKKNDPGDSSRPIPLEDVLEAIGCSPARVAAIVQDADDMRRLDGLFR